MVRRGNITPDSPEVRQLLSRMPPQMAAMVRSQMHQLRGSQSFGGVPSGKPVSDSVCDRLKRKSTDTIPSESTTANVLGSSSQKKQNSLKEKAVGPRSEPGQWSSGSGFAHLKRTPGQSSTAATGISDREAHRLLKKRKQKKNGERSYAKRLEERMRAVVDRKAANAVPCEKKGGR